MSCMEEAGRREEALSNREFAEMQLDNAWENWMVAMGGFGASCGAAVIEVFANPFADAACAAAIYNAYVSKERVEKAQETMDMAEAEFNDAEDAYWGCWDSCPPWANKSGPV